MRCVGANLIFKTDGGESSEDEGADVEGDDEEGEEEGGEEADGEQAAPVRGRKEVRWAVPEGFQVANEPDKLDDSLVGMCIYMRWEVYGWQLGKITDTITSATPRLAKKFNYRIMWADGHKGPAKLAVDNYGYGTHAAFNSWVILQQNT